MAHLEVGSLNSFRMCVDAVRRGGVISVVGDVITHRMPLSEVAQAYEIFNGKKDACVKVVLRP